MESDGATAGNADGTYAPESSGIRNQEGADRPNSTPGNHICQIGFRFLALPAKR